MCGAVFHLLRCLLKSQGFNNSSVFLFCQLNQNKEMYGPTLYSLAMLYSQHPWIRTPDSPAPSNNPFQDTDLFPSSSLSQPRQDDLKYTSRPKLINPSSRPKLSRPCLPATLRFPNFEGSDIKGDMEC